MSASAKRKLLGELSGVSVKPDPENEPVEPVSSTAERLQELQLLVQQKDTELARLREELSQSRLQLEKLQESIARGEKEAYQTAVEQGRADGAKAFEEKLQELEARHNKGLDELVQVVESAVQEDRAFIQQNIADTVAVSVARIIGESRINPNYLADSIYKVVEELRSPGRVEVLVAENVHAALMRNRVVFDRIAQVASITCKADMKPFGILVDVEDEVVDVSYETQLRKVHQLISHYLAAQNA